MGRRLEPIERVEIEVFVVDDAAAGPAADGHPSIRSSIADHARHGYAAARDIHAAPGPRPGIAPPTTTTRRGGDCDIVRSMRIDPWTASMIAGSSSFQGDRHRYLRFLETDADDDRSLTWQVVVESPRLRAVRATLHLRAAPSMVVSVLELVPRRRLRWRRAAFITTGVEAVESLAHEFELDAAACA